MIVAKVSFKTSLEILPEFVYICEMKNEGEKIRLKYNRSNV